MHNWWSTISWRRVYTHVIIISALVGDEYKGIVSEVNSKLEETKGSKFVTVNFENEIILLLRNYKHCYRIVFLIKIRTAITSLVAMFSYLYNKLYSFVRVFLAISSLYLLLVKRNKRLSLWVVFVFFFLCCMKSKKLMKECFEKPLKKGLCDTHSLSLTNSTTPKIRGLYSGITFIL